MEVLDAGGDIITNDPGEPEGWRVRMIGSLKEDKLRVQLVVSLDFVLALE